MFMTAPGFELVWTLFEAPFPLHKKAIMNNSRQRTNARRQERMWREVAAAALVRLLTYVITSLKICAERGQMNRELDLIKTNLSWLNKSYPISNINRKSVRVGVTGDECNNKNDWALAWLSWSGCHFRHQRSAVQLRAFAKFIDYRLYKNCVEKTKIKQKRPRMVHF